MGLVHVSPVEVHQPVLTGPIEDWLAPVAAGPNISLNWFSGTNCTVSIVMERGWEMCEMYV